MEMKPEVKAGYSRILGVDEAGRGPMAGPLCCWGGVIFPEDFYDERINDSKRSSQKRKEKHSMTSL